MSVLGDLIFDGANAVTGITESALNSVIAKFGREQEISFPDTQWFFPIVYAVTGIKVKTLGDLLTAVGEAKVLLSKSGAWVNNGLSAIIGTEILEGLKYLEASENQKEGFLSDKTVRTMVAAKYPDAAVVLYRSGSMEDAVDVVRQYRSRNVLTFAVGEVAETCQEIPGVVVLGQDSMATVHAISGGVRAALMSGKVQPGDRVGLMEYTRNKVPILINTFGSIDAMVLAVIAGAGALGFPAVVDIDLGDNQISGLLESVCDHGETVEKSLEIRRKEPIF